MLDPCASRAGSCVVELDEDEIKPDVLNNLTKMSIWHDALRSTRDVVALGVVGREQLVLEVHDHLRITTGHVIVNGFAIVSRSRRNFALNIEIEPIHDGISEGTRVLGISPRRSNRTKGSPQEFGEFYSLSRSSDKVVGWVASAEREEDLLAILLLASGDVRTDVRTIREELGAAAVLVLISSTTASIPKVASRVPA